MLRFGLLFFAVLIEIALAPPAGAAKRVALVIGNGAYAQAGTLTNPVNDATDMANALKRFGFDVILGLDLDRRRFDEKVRAFSNVLEEADAAVLFYAGHGLQVAGLSTTPLVMHQAARAQGPAVCRSWVRNKRRSFADAGAFSLSERRLDPLSGYNRESRRIR
jgi:caspase domain-containing protein